MTKRQNRQSVMYLIPITCLSLLTAICAWAQIAPAGSGTPGADADPARLEQLTADQLTPVEGCDVTFTKVNEALYRGEMGEGKTCKSSRRGATHMISRAELTPTATITLDQGFDDAGNHKWGPPAEIALNRLFQKGDFSKSPILIIQLGEPAGREQNIDHADVSFFQKEF